jgi:hypothetical protein
MGGGDGGGGRILNFSTLNVVQYISLRLRLHLYRIVFRSDMERHLSVPSRNAIFREIIATERCWFAQLQKVEHSVSNIRCFFASLRKAIRYNVNAFFMVEKIIVTALLHSYSTINQRFSEIIGWGRRLPPPPSPPCV